MNRSIRFALLLSGGLFLAMFLGPRMIPCTASGSDVAGGADSSRAVRASVPEPVTLSVENMEIKEVLSMFSRTRGLNIVAAGDVAGQVSIDLHGVPFDQALRAAVAMAGFEVVHQGDIYFVRRPSGDDAATSVLKDVRTYRLNYAVPEKTLSVLQQMLSPVGKVTNYLPMRTLVAEDRPEVLDRIDSVVRALDVPPRQVLIEARILEVRLSKDMNLGIDWSLLFSKGKGRGRVDVEGFATGAAAGNEGAFLLWGEGDFATAIQGLEGVEELNTLSAPRLLVMDGTQAEIIIGGELGFPVVTTVENTVIQSVQFLSVGAQLKLTPTITDDGFIMMKVHPELSDGVVQQGIPSKSTAEVTTEVLVRDGQVLFIGGLIRDRDEKTRKGIPVLVRIPILGPLFGRTVHSRQKSELITLITPRIVAPGAAVDIHANGMDRLPRP